MVGEEKETKPLVDLDEDVSGRRGIDEPFKARSETETSKGRRGNREGGEERTTRTQEEEREGREQTMEMGDGERQ